MSTEPDVTIGDDWVAVQWGERGPLFVLDRDGAVTERLTVPALDGPAALPFSAVGGAA